jgi:hypothetical protein
VRSRGWLTDDEELRLSPSGAAHRQEVEDTTDRLAVHAYSALGDDACSELRALARPFSQSVVASGTFGTTRPREVNAPRMSDDRR